MELPQRLEDYTVRAFDKPLTKLVINVVTISDGDSTAENLPSAACEQMPWVAHPPGHAQADFGEADAYIAGVKLRAHFFALDLPHSDACFVKAYPAATTEAWLGGHNSAFAFFEGVLRSVLYDNDTCLVARILPDGTRQRTRAFSGLQSHYIFEEHRDLPRCFASRIAERYTKQRGSRPARGAPASGGGAERKSNCGTATTRPDESRVATVG